jgi:hypothetical protein
MTTFYLENCVERERFVKQDESRKVESVIQEAAHNCLKKKLPGTHLFKKSKLEEKNHDFLIAKHIFVNQKIYFTS